MSISIKQCGADGQWTESARSVSCKGEVQIPGATAMTTTKGSFSVLKRNTDNVFLQISTSARYQMEAAVTSVVILLEATNVNVQTRN